MLNLRLNLTLLFLLIAPLLILAQTDEVILTGKISSDEFKNPWAIEWLENKQNYVPDSLLIERLKKVLVGKSVKLTVYLATWCEDSKMHVPALLKIAEILNLDVDYICVNRKKECPLPNCETWDVLYVPTFVVTSNGTELKRIIETPEQSVEADLLKMLTN